MPNDFYFSVGGNDRRTVDDCRKHTVPIEPFKVTIFIVEKFKNNVLIVVSLICYEIFAIKIISNIAKSYQINYGFIILKVIICEGKGVSQKSTYVRNCYLI